MIGRFPDRGRRKKIFIQGFKAMRFFQMIQRAFAAVAALVLFTAGCAAPVRDNTRRDARRGSILISWEFKTIEKDGDPYTDAVMVVSGNPSRKHPLGLFHGKVNKILASADRIKEMEGGTLSGFVTSNHGGGYEVVVRYDEKMNRLYVMFREINGNNFPGTFKALKNIFLPREYRPNTGF